MPERIGELSQQIAYRAQLLTTCFGTDLEGYQAPLDPGITGFITQHLNSPELPRHRWPDLPFGDRVLVFIDRVPEHFSFRRVQYVMHWAGESAMRLVVHRNAVHAQSTLVIDADDDQGWRANASYSATINILEPPELTSDLTHTNQVLLELGHQALRSVRANRQLLHYTAPTAGIDDSATDEHILKRNGAATRFFQLQVGLVDQSLFEADLPSLEVLPEAS